MKRVKLDFEITDLDGKAVPNAAPAHKIVAGALIQGENSDPLKVMEWALELSKNGELILDSSDYDKFKADVSEIKFPVITKAPVLRAINEAKEVERASENKVKKS